MNNEFITKTVDILGVSEDGINILPEDILGSMQAVYDNVVIKNDEDREILYAELDKLWVKGNVLIGLKEVADNTGIAYKTLCNLDYDTQQELVFEYMADSGNTNRLYEITNSALAVIELEMVSKLINVPVSTLRTLPIDIQEKMCGMYSMEYEENADNSELITALKGLVNP